MNIPKNIVVQLGAILFLCFIIDVHCAPVIESRGFSDNSFENAFDSRELFDKSSEEVQRPRQQKLVKDIILATPALNSYQPKAGYVAIYLKLLKMVLIFGSF